MIFYYATVLVLLIFAAPYLLASAKRRAGLFQKLGIVPSNIASNISSARSRNSPRQPAVWFHAVSVGEFNGLLPLIQEFKKRNRQIQIFVSTTTSTGQTLAKQRLGAEATVLYFPLDLAFAIRAWLDVIKPDLVVFVETEIWPGFTYECQQRNIRLAMVNARMSPKSFNRYYRLRKFFAPVINRFELIAAQSEEEANRFRQVAGVASENYHGRIDPPFTVKPEIKVTGNLKYDQLQPAHPAAVAQLRRQLGIEDSDWIIMGGSTHDGEEAALLEAYDQLLKRPVVRAGGDHKSASTCRLILAPRYPEHCQSVCRLVESYSFHPRRYSAGQSFNSNRDVYVLDTIGLLSQYYALASVVFVGGSLVPVGGHNLVEPYVNSVPVVCGPQLFKTISVARQLQDAGALTIINDKDQLYNTLAQLLDDDALRHKRGVAGNAWLQRSQGAIGKTLRLLEDLLHQLNDQHSALSAPVQSDKVTADISSTMTGNSEDGEAP